MELEAPGRCWKAAHSRRRWNGTYEDFESTCPCVPSQWVIQSAVGNLPVPWPASWLLAVGHPVSLYWSVLCSQTREASCPTGYASQSEISSGGTICAGVLTLGKQEKKIGD